MSYQCNFFFIEFIDSMLMPFDVGSLYKLSLIISV